jgi:hypothetical protein
MTPKRLAIALLPLAVTVGAIFLIVKFLNLGHVEAAMLSMEGALKTPPDPQDTTLRLRASDVDSSCGEDKVVDVVVDESDSEVVVEASLRIDTGGLNFNCEIRDASVPFEASLDRPLGRRSVIDNSRGTRTVIWSLQARKDIRLRQQVEPADAESFLKSKLPPGQDLDCHEGGVTYFACSVRVPRVKRSVIFYVFIHAKGELEAKAGENLPPELRTCAPGQNAAHAIC